MALVLTADALNVERGALITLDEYGAVTLTRSLPPEARLWERVTAHNLINYVIYTCRPLNIPDLSADERWTTDGWRGSAYVMPLLYKERLWGVYFFLSPRKNHFEGKPVDFLHEAAAATAAALENWVRYEKVKTAESQTRRLYEKVQQDQVEQTRAEEMRRDLTAMVYHDLRSPLQNIAASFSGLNRVLAGNEQAIVHELLRVGTQSLRQLTRMVKSLLDVERLEEGRAILGRQSTKLHNLLSDALELVYPAAREAEQTLALDLDDDLPSVYVDADMILRVLTNLVENAIKHTPTGGHITVRAAVIEGAVRVSVADTGRGVPQRFHHEVFDKYFRIKYVHAPSGVGLGLAFCRLAVEAHGGEIWVENDPHSGGAVFSFTLPLTAESLPLP